MIDEYFTWVFYGYHGDELSYGSEKPIVVVCDECYKYRISTPNSYRDLCGSCAKSGERNPSFGMPRTDKQTRGVSESNRNRVFTAEARLKRSKAMKGKKLPPFTDDHKQKISASHQGISIEDWVDYTTKDWRDWSKALFLNDPFPGCARHHITNTIVVCIPIELHEHIHHNMHTGRHMDMINALAIQFIIGEW